MKKDCPIIDDTEGVTLTSLGGVFIVTAFGLIFAASVLSVEVWTRQQEAKPRRLINSSSVSEEGGHWFAKGWPNSNVCNQLLEFTFNNSAISEGHRAVVMAGNMVHPQGKVIPVQPVNRRKSIPNRY